MERMYLIDKNQGYKGSVISTVYNGFVDYSSSLHNDNKGNLTVDEYAKLEGLEPLVLTWEELYPIIEKWEQDHLITKWQEVTEEHFYDMFEVLPPMRMTRTKTGFFFFISEMTSGNISACYLKDGEKFYSATKRVSDPTGKIMVEFQQDIFGG